MFSSRLGSTFINSSCKFKVSGYPISFCPNDVRDNLYKHMSDMNEGQICSEGSFALSIAPMLMSTLTDYNLSTDLLYLDSPQKLFMHT